MEFRPSFGWSTVLQAQRESNLTSVNDKKGTSVNGSATRGATSDPWEQSRTNQAGGREPLAASKLAKNEAEYARQNIANEILEAAKTVCGELIADTERTLEKARYLEGEADRKHVEAHEERERASEIRLEAEEYRESLIEDAKRQSTEHIERARAATARALFNPEHPSLLITYGPPARCRRQVGTLPG